MKTYTIALTEYDRETGAPQMLIATALDDQTEALEDQIADALNCFDDEPVVELHSGLTLLGVQEASEARDAGAEIIYWGDDLGRLADENGDEYYAAAKI